MAEWKILVMDDSEITLEVARSALLARGYTVYTASNLVEFDKIVEEKKPNLIIIDIKMPDIQGDKICEVLKKNVKTRDIPIVLFSSLKDQELSELAKRSRADGYISKEHGMDELMDIIQQVVDGILW